MLSSEASAEVFSTETEILMPSENTGVRSYLKYCIIQERPPRVTLFAGKGSVIASTAPILAITFVFEIQCYCV